LTAGEMQIVHTLGTLRPGHDGVTRVMYRLREGFVSEPSAHHRYISPILPDYPVEGFYGVPSVPLPFNPDYRVALCTARSIRRILKPIRPDVIHMHSPCPLGLASVRYARQEGIPVVATYHTHFPTYMPYYGLDFIINPMWRYIRWLYSQCDAVIVPSKTTLRELEFAGVPNLVHIPHGVNTEGFSPKHRSVEWRRSIGADGRLILAFAGRLVWEKNLMALVEASKLIQDKDAVKFVFIGDGPALSKMKELMPEAHFTGFLKDEQLRVAYASSDIFVFPSLTETFGNVTVEAMASGLPALCARAGGACDFVQSGVNGLLVDPGQGGQGFAEKIQYLLNHPELRQQYSHAAVLSAQRYRWESTVDRYLKLYPEVARLRLSAPQTQLLTRTDSAPSQQEPGWKDARF
jgi:phosphatidylinositol alpha 1,6-mannosyltransferase